MRSFRFALGAALAAWFVACGDDGGPTEPPGPPAEVTKTAGDGQAWYFGNPLPDPYRVTVRDANFRNVPNVTVTWSVVAGGGSVSPATSQTDANGVATTTHTLGPTATSQGVLATVADLSVGFTATAEAAPTNTTAEVAVGNGVGNWVFVPAEIALKVSGTVTWTWNSGLEQHNVTFTGGPTTRPANSPTRSTPFTYNGTFTTIGRFTYTCTLHSGMNGEVHVVN